jgi:citrate synthase
MQAPASTPSGNLEHSDFISSAEALAILGVKPQTLYSYVSRGMIRRICLDGKNSLYSREDVRRLKARSTARSGHGAVAGGALQWGEPVLVTGITEITQDGPRYRDYLAVELAREGYNFESVAEYLWGGAELHRSAQWSWDESIHHIAPQVAALTGAYPNIHLRQILTEIVVLLCIEESQPPTTQLEPTLPQARALIQALCLGFGFIGPNRRFVAPQKNETIAGYILRAFGVPANRTQTRVLDAVLVLLADHEFSPATFAARIAASSGVDLYSCIGAALHVHFGSALGLRCDRIEQTLEAAMPKPGEVTGQGDNPSPFYVGPLGFNHPLYVEGDPRANEILTLALSLSQHARASRDAIQRLKNIDGHQGAMSLDAALVVLCRALGLHGRVAGGLLSISRSAGWIAHVIEQHKQDFMIRPRGKFTAAKADQSAA